MKIKDLKNKIEEQKKINIELFYSIPIASHEDPMNEKAEPILEEWRKGSKKLKAMIKELNDLEKAEKVETRTEENKKIFVNGFGEATKRNITCTGYERAEKRNAQAILSFMDNR